MSIAARPDSNTSLCVTLARKAACVLLNTVMSAMTISDNSAIATITSMRVKAKRFAICDLRFTIEKGDREPSRRASVNCEFKIGKFGFTVHW